MEISFEIVGPDYAPRYRIWSSDQKYWTGKRWSRNVKKALIYADKNVLATDFNDLQAKVNEGKPVYEFTTNVTVKVFSKTPVSPEQIAEYLNRAFHMGLKDKENGMGPTPDSFTEVAVEWNDLKPSPQNVEQAKKKAE